MNTTGNVIKILDEFTLVINIGSNEIEKGSWISVIEEGPTIKNIDGTVLGTYDFTKAKLRVTEVYENFSIAKHLTKTKPLSVEKILGGGGYSSNGPLPIEKEAEITRVSPKNMKITIGDLVKVI